MGSPIIMALCSNHDAEVPDAVRFIAGELAA